MEFAMVLLNHKLHDPVDQGVIYSYPSLVVCRYFLSSLFPFPFSFFVFFMSKKSFMEDA